MLGRRYAGTAAEADPFLSVDGGLIVAARAADDSSVNHRLGYGGPNGSR